MAQELSIVNDFQAKLKEKIKKDFAGMIPEEAWDKLVHDQVTEFIQKDLGGLVKEELGKEVRKQLQIYFDSAEWKGEWAGDAVGIYHERASVKAKELIRENIPFIVEAMMGQSVQMAIQAMRNALGSRGW